MISLQKREPLDWKTPGHVISRLGEELRRAVEWRPLALPAAEKHPVDAAATLILGVGETIEAYGNVYADTEPTSGDMGW